jgi:amidase
MKGLCKPQLLLLVVVAGFFMFSLLGRAAAQEPAKLQPVGINLHEISIESAQQAMADGRLSAVKLASYYLQQIEARNERLNAVISINPDLLAQARALDEERSAGNVRGPLHGIPVLLKDNIEAREKMPTTAGSLALQNNYTGRDAAITKKLRASGALILGKANLSEWANFRSTRSSSGWSGVGGQTRNPYDLNKTACGSSSGSAVAAAADLTLLAIGTETDGSITCPASINGIVGIKPTIGLISRSGIVPISHRQDTAGPMARSVHDAAVLLTAMAGYDETDASTTHALTKGVFGIDYSRRLDQVDIQGKRIGVLRGSAGFHDQVDVLFEQAISDLKNAGAIIIDDLALEHADDEDEYFDNYLNTLLHDFKRDLNAYLAALPETSPQAADLDALIAFNQANADRELLWFGQDLWQRAVTLIDFDDAQYGKTVAALSRITREAIDGLLQEHKLDALIAPTRAPAWSIDKINGDPDTGGTSTYAAIAGYPHISVPMGFVHHLPVGLSFLGTAFAEVELIRIAHVYEQASQRRRPPPESAEMILP